MKKKLLNDMKEMLSSFRKNNISLQERQQTPAPETDPEYEIKNYPRLLQLARAGLVPEDLVWKMTNVLKDPKKFGVSPQIRNQLYDLMIKTLNYIVVSDPAAWARFRSFLMNEEFKDILGGEISKINPSEKAVMIRNQIKEKKEFVKEPKQKKSKSIKQTTIAETISKVEEIPNRTDVSVVVEEKTEPTETVQEPIIETVDLTSTQETSENGSRNLNESDNKLYKELSNIVEEVLKKELAKYSMYA